MSMEDTTIDCVPDDALKEIMLRLPTSAALVHSALSSKRWHHIIAAQQFLEEYRKRHASSPFIGLYVPKVYGGLPSFLMADSIRCTSNGGGDLDLIRAAARAFSLEGLEGHPEWRLLDCHNGRLLLARGDKAIEVYSPLAREHTPLCHPQDDAPPSNFSACLLQGHGDDAASFRVVSVQHRRHSRIREVQTIEVRAIEYDSRSKIWTDHPWKIVNNIKVYEQEQLMQAGRFIFCRGSSLVLLDTNTMEFSSLPIPRDNKNYAIGEMDDGVCCLVSVDSVGIWNKIQLRMWKLENLDWKLEKEVGVGQLLGNHSHNQYYRVRAVTNGLALLCSFKRHVHFIIDLKTFSVKDKFEFMDLVAYPLQMPWPPTFSMDVSSGQHAQEADALLIPDQDLVGYDNFNGIVDKSVCDQTETSAPYRTICNEIQQRDTLTNAGVEKIKTVNYDGNEMLLHGSHDNWPGLIGEAIQQNCMPSSTPEHLGIQEAPKFRHLKKRRSLTKNGSCRPRPFAVVNGLPSKYNIKNPKKFGYTRTAVKEAATAKQSAMVCNKKKKELGAGKDQSLSFFEFSTAKNDRECDELKETPSRKRVTSISTPITVSILRRSKRKIVTVECSNAKCGMARCTACFAITSSRSKSKARKDVNETLLHGSHDNGPGFRGEAIQQNRMPSSIPEHLGIQEAAKFRHLKKRRPKNGSCRPRPFAVVNGLSPKYNIKNPEKFSYTRTVVKEEAIAKQNAMVCNKKTKELGTGKDQSLSVFQFGAAENDREGDELKKTSSRKRAASISTPVMVSTLRQSKRRIVTVECCNAQCGMARCTTCFAITSTHSKSKAKKGSGRMRTAPPEEVTD